MCVRDSRVCVRVSASLAQYRPLTLHGSNWGAELAHGSSSLSLSLGASSPRAALRLIAARGPGTPGPCRYCGSTVPDNSTDAPRVPPLPTAGGWEGSGGRPAPPSPGGVARAATGVPVGPLAPPWVLGADTGTEGLGTPGAGEATPAAGNGTMVKLGGGGGKGRAREVRSATVGRGSGCVEA
jgi:hypothetical protein